MGVEVTDMSPAVAVLKTLKQYGLCDEIVGNHCWLGEEREET